MEMSAQLTFVNGEDMVAELPQGPLNIGHSKNTNNPAELILSAIAGCSVGVMKMVLDKRKITYKELCATAVLKINETVSPDKLEAVDIQMTISQPSKGQEVLDKALVQAVQNCPIVQSLKHSITVTEAITIQ